MQTKLKIAVLLEWHPYDVMNFQAMLWSFDDCDCYVQPLDLFAQDLENQNTYDVVVYYNMSLPRPAEDGPVYKYLTTALGSTGQGIVLLHHGVLSYPGWGVWTEVSGLKVRCEKDVFQYHQNQLVQSQPALQPHPITSGIEAWSMRDETYIIGEPIHGDNHILLTTDNPKSIQNIAWTRSYKRSRVCCYASGHDNQAYANPNFRMVLHNAILWCANRI